MSSAIDLGGTARPEIKVVGQHRRPDLRQHSNIRVSVDYRRSVLWTKFAESAPVHITELMLKELLAICETVKGHVSSPFRYRVLASERRNVFCLGGDLRHFRKCIEEQDEDALRRYAYFAIDAIWESITGSSYEDLCSIALVESEAQGGGFEAALASHIFVAEKGASFGFPESLFGLFPGMGAYELLCARTDSQTARKVIGSAQRYSAQQLFDLGIIDALAEVGCGKEVVDSIVSSHSTLEVNAFRSRFASITKEGLLSTVDEWVDQALSISDRHLKTIGYILQAQQRAVSRDHAGITSSQAEAGVGGGS